MGPRSIPGWTYTGRAAHYGRRVDLIRKYALDAVLVVVAGAVAVSVLASDERPRILIAVMSAAAVLVFCARRIAPLAVVVASFGIQAIGMTKDPTATPLQFVALVLAFALAGAICRGRDAIIAAVLGVALLAYATMGIPTGAGPGDFVLSCVFAMGFFWAGHLLARRNRQLESTREQAAVVAAEHEARTQRALMDERARIARELHDVVSHGLSVVVVQAQAAQAAAADLTGPVDAVTTRLNSVEDTAREALGEMRRMLGLLQLDEIEGDGPEPPSPGLAEIPGLVDRARAAGATVAYDSATTLGGLGAGTQLAIYRVVQESLTNVLKHAPGATVSVAIEDRGSAVRAVVRNEVTGDRSVLVDSGGHGLVGMRERAAAYGGRCSAGLVEPGTFEVCLELPVEAGRPA